MNLTHRGKIGLLPTALQEQVNRRLQSGEKAGPLVAWLNSLPEMQSVLAGEFENIPVSKQNLSEWRKRGYKKWLCHQEAQTLAAQIGNLPPAPGAPPLTDQMTTWLSVQYLMAVRKLVDKNAPGETDLNVLREFCLDVVALRRNELGEARLKFEQERLELRMQKLQDQAVVAQPSRLRVPAASRCEDLAISPDSRIEPPSGSNLNTFLFDKTAAAFEDLHGKGT